MADLLLVTPTIQASKHAACQTARCVMGVAVNPNQLARARATQFD